MKTSDVNLLLCVEGRALDHDHWISRWARNLRTGRLVDITAAPAASGACVSPLHAALDQTARPIVLVGYHLGVAGIVAAAETLATKPIKGAFFVAPADLKLSSCEQLDAGTLSNAPLPFPSLLVASRSDPRCSFETASDMALAWGSHLVDAGDVGQIDPSSGHGPWPEGLMRLGWFLKRL